MAQIIVAKDYTNLYKLKYINKYTMSNKKKEIEEIKGGMEQIKLLADFLSADEVLEREVTSYGNSCHIPIPSKHKGKMAKIIIKPKKEEGVKKKK